MLKGQFGCGGVTVGCVGPVYGYQILSSYFNVSQLSRQTYTETMQLRLFEEWIEKGHQRDAKLCGAYARPTNECSLVRGGEEYCTSTTKALLYTWPRRAGVGCVRVLMEWVEWM